MPLCPASILSWNYERPEVPTGLSLDRQISCHGSKEVANILHLVLMDWDMKARKDLSTSSALLRTLAWPPAAAPRMALWRASSGKNVSWTKFSSEYILLQVPWQFGGWINSQLSSIFFKNRTSISAFSTSTDLKRIEFVSALTCLLRYCCALLFSSS